MDVASNITIEGGAIENSGASAVYLGPNNNNNFLSTFLFCDARDVLNLYDDVTLRFFSRFAQRTPGCTLRLVAPESHVVRVYIRVRPEVVTSSSTDVARFYDGSDRLSENLIETFSVRSNEEVRDVIFTSLTRELTVHLLVEEDDVEYSEISAQSFQSKIRH